MKYKIFEILVDKNKGIKPVNSEKFVLDFPSDNYKIYILKKNAAYIYVGITKQGIGTRFGQSFRAYTNAKQGNKDRDGYSGYKWIEKLHKEKLTLFVFDMKGIKKEKHIEAIEAEISYLIRNKYHMWPEYQNEIHFNNNFDDALGKAIRIFSVAENAPLKL